MITLPVLTTEQMRQWEEDSWKNGISQLDVIRTVGEDVAKYMLRIIYDTISDCYNVLESDSEENRKGVEQIMQMQQILVLVGPGHNGDDARVAANFLRGKVKEVQILEVKDTQKALKTFKKLVADRKNFFEPMTTSSRFCPTFILDGMFGIGLNRPLSQDYVDLINAVNESQIPIVAVDIPSGLNEEGMPCPVAVRAQFTLTVGALKRCLTRGESSKYIGKIEVLEDIGLNPDIPAGDLECIKQVNPAEVVDLNRPLDCHKGDFGHTLILAGSIGYHGAAVLAAKAAAAAKPGLITVCTMPETYIPVASHLVTQMVHSWSPEWQMPKGITSILVGPGLAAPSIPQAFWDWVRELWRSFPGNMIADASALDRIPEGETAGVRVITPHPGEAARCLGITTKEVQADRLGALRKLSEKYGDAYVVLKGYQTLTGTAKGKVYLNHTGNPAMAQGGTGDVLAGFLSGLFAYDRIKEEPIDNIKRICYAVYSHGRAADEIENEKKTPFDVHPWTAVELIKYL